MSRTVEPYQADLLIVDDVPDNIRFLSSFLVQKGYQVRKAINGQMALTTIKILAPDLILLDANLPDITGYEVCQSLKNNPATCTIPIIFLSAGDATIDKVKAFQMGAADYITKPFNLEEALVRIQTQLTIQALQKELQTQNLQLKQALEELKTAQVSLVQQERMSTLRKVVAGVAHEVNNPLSFISCNIEPAQEYIKHLLNIIKLYQQEGKTVDSAMKAYLEEIDLEFIASDLLNIIDSMKNGAERIRAVMLALRIFTRLDETGVKAIDLHENINNVLVLLQQRLVSRSDGKTIQIETEYTELPFVSCYADQINQVVFNLLCNAIDAIDEKLKKADSQSFIPKITIRTQSDSSTVTLHIQDNGIGLSEAVKSRIFEPFFTTKPAGYGVGLGLATSQRIVEDTHGGRLTCASLGQGAEFSIQLPV